MFSSTVLSSSVVPTQLVSSTHSVFDVSCSGVPASISAYQCQLDQHYHFAQLTDHAAAQSYTEQLMTQQVAPCFMSADETGPPRAPYRIRHGWNLTELDALLSSREISLREKIAALQAFEASTPQQETRRGIQIMRAFISAQQPRLNKSYLDSSYAHIYVAADLLQNYALIVLIQLLGRPDITLELEALAQLTKFIHANATGADIKLIKIPGSCELDQLYRVAPNVIDIHRPKRLLLRRLADTLSKQLSTRSEKYDQQNILFESTRIQLEEARLTLDKQELRLNQELQADRIIMSNFWNTEFPFILGFMLFYFGSCTIPTISLAGYFMSLGIAVVILYRFVRSRLNKLAIHEEMNHSASAYKDFQDVRLQLADEWHRMKTPARLRVVITEDLAAAVQDEMAENEQIAAEEDEVSDINITS